MIKLPRNVTAYIDQLNDQEQDRLLTTTLVAGTICGGTIEHPAGCLVGAARGAAEIRDGIFLGYNVIPHTDWWDFTLFADGRVGRASNLDLYEWSGMIAQTFNRLALIDQAGTQEAIRDYIRQRRAAVAQIITESSELSPA